MVKAQEWLEKYYSDKETERIYINQQLEGVLDCSEYKKLERIFISIQVDKSKFEIKKGSYRKKESFISENSEKEKIKETKIIPRIPAQTYLDQNYPKNGTCIIRKNEDERFNNFGKTRKETRWLNINDKGLEGELDLSDFENLEVLTCSDNFLTNLNLNNCKKL